MFNWGNRQLKNYFDEQVTKFGNKQENGKFDESSPLKWIRSGWRKNGGQPKQKGKHFKSAVLKRTTRSRKSGRQTTKLTSPVCWYHHGYNWWRNRCDNGNWWWVFISSQTNDYCLCHCGVLLYFQVSPYYVQFLIYYSVFFGKKNNRKLNKWNKIPISVFYLNLIILICDVCLWHITTKLNCTKARTDCFQTCW